MKEINIKLYEYGELSDKAKERALDDWNRGDYDPMMKSHMTNLLKEKLDERGMKYDTNSICAFYSFNNRQGDGFVFEGKIEHKGHTVDIMHSDAFYYHKYTASFDFQDDNGECTLSAGDMESFKQAYREICDDMEKIGYDHIEYEQSEDNFMSVCEANGYMFEENGKMWNE